ncbi:HAD hydrolase family protein [Methylocaldum sp.]|uniref:KdsC family phosphatase n=1 Tax=Methylocaldum sp. TaxID=1969727 RepID=UPI00321FE82D
MGTPPVYTQAQGLGRLGELSASIRLVVFDFDGVFTDNGVYVTHDGIESVRCWRSDGVGLTRLRSIGVQLLILSTEVNPVVTVRANKLKMACRQGIEDKAAIILEACLEHDINPAQAAFVGNDINDIPAFKIVGLPIAVADAYPEVFPHVLYRTVRAGGYGAVREVCDIIFHAKQGSLDKLETYVP